MDTLAELYGFRRGDFLGREGEAIGTLVDKAGREQPVESLLQVLESVRARGGKGFVIQRYKGLGEMDKEQLFETTMDPANRKMLKVSLDDALEADSVFSLLMGDEVAPRRRWIEENSLMAEIDA
jgi:DNA gyrase subunit B